MLESVGREIPTDDISKAVFYLVKEVGVSHEEIFGSTEYVNIVEEVDRDGVLGNYLDDILGKKKKEKTVKTKTRGMRLKTFAAYMELLEEHQKEKEKQQKKQKLRQSMRTGTIG